MSVISSQLMMSNSTLEIDHEYKEQITEQYLVLSTNKLERGVTILHQSLAVADGGVLTSSATIDPVPAMWSQYNEQASHHREAYFTGTVTAPNPDIIYLLKKRVRRHAEGENCYIKKSDGSLVFPWIVECIWGIPPDDWTGAAPPADDPLLDPVLYTTDYVPFTKETDIYYTGTDNTTGTALVNFAGDPFDPRIERDDNRVVITAWKNVATFDDVVNMARNYKDHTNLDVFRGHPPYTAKIDAIGTTGQLERSGRAYWPVFIKVQCLEGSGTGTATGTAQGSFFNLTKAQRGWQTMDEAAAALHQFNKVYPRTATGTYRGEYLDMVNLNTDGKLLGTGVTPIMSNFRIYPAKNFSDLGI